MIIILIYFVILLLIWLLNFYDFDLFVNIYTRLFLFLVLNIPSQNIRRDNKLAMNYLEYMFEIHFNLK